MKPSLFWSTYLFIKNRMILEYKVTLFSAQTAQWELYFQRSFCDKL